MRIIKRPVTRFARKTMPLYKSRETVRAGVWRKHPRESYAAEHLGRKGTFKPRKLALYESEVEARTVRDKYCIVEQTFERIYHIFEQRRNFDFGWLEAGEIENPLRDKVLWIDTRVKCFDADAVFDSKYPNLNYATACRTCARSFYVDDCKIPPL